MELSAHQTDVEAPEGNSEAERALSFHYLQNGDLQKAENILTHHLRTQTNETIDATAYFDMAYLAFKNKKYDQSRDFFKRYVEVGDDPKLSERAQQVIQKLDTIQ